MTFGWEKQMAENDEELDNWALVEENVDNIVMVENDEELDNGELKLDTKYQDSYFRMDEDHNWNLFSNTRTLWTKESTDTGHLKKNPP